MHPKRDRSAFVGPAEQVAMGLGFARRTARRGRWLVGGVVVALVLSGAACSRDSAAAHAAEREARVERQARIFAATCAHCHVGVDRGIPRAGVPGDWNARPTRDFETLVAHTIEGHGDMPPLGTCSFCTDEDLRALVAWLIAGSEIEAPDPRSEPAR